MKINNIVLFVILLTSGLFSQSFYIKLGSGYGIPLSTQTIYDYSFRVTNGSSTLVQNRKAKEYSFGNGIYLGGTVGYMINRNIGVDLDFQYLRGSSVTYNGDYGYNRDNTYAYENYANALMIIPSVMLKTELGFLKPYFKAGPVLGFPSITKKTTSSYPSTLPPGTALVYQELLDNGGIAIGFNAVLGVSAEVLKNTDVFFEINSKNQSYAPTKGEYKQYTINGKDMLAGAPTYSKYINYEDNSTTYDGSADPNPNQANVMPRVSYPFSSLVFSIGLSYNL